MVRIKSLVGGSALYGRKIANAIVHGPVWVHCSKGNESQRTKKKMQADGMRRGTEVGPWAEGIE